MSRNKDNKYSHKMGKWRPETYCTFPKCEKETVTCEHGFCGHYVYWIYSNRFTDRKDGRWYEANKRIAHAHFLMNTDTGRHVDDNVGNVWIHESDCVIRAKIMNKPNYRFPSWVMESSD
ncbi:MAG TPA: hypothetical protein VF220_03755 [Nitrososphaeraceae archaeon]